jgi:two-component system OmpR family response regulator
VSLPELLARIRAVHRRRHPHGSPLPRRRHAHFAAWSLDEAGHRLVDRAGREVDLSPGELSVLVALLQHPGRVLSRVELLTLTRVDDGEVFERTIDVLVSRIRRKLDAGGAAKPVIRTVRGGGYQLAVPVTWTRTDDPPP